MGSPLLLHSSDDIMQGLAAVAEEGLYRGYIGIMEKKMEAIILGFRVQGLGFRKIRDTILEVPIISIIVFGGLYWGPII